MNTKFPYECVIKETGKRFIPILIDYMNKLVQWQKGQSSDNGEWLDFEDVEFFKIETFIDLSEYENL